MPKAILITGSNKGIGYEIAKKYYQNDCTDQNSIILTSRNLEAGKTAVEKLKTELGLSLDNSIFDVVQLDVTDLNSRNNCISSLLKKYGPNSIEILINNAGFAYKQGATENFHTQAKDTLAINYFGLKNFTLEMIQNDVLVQKGGKILNCCSMVSCFFYKKLAPEEQALFASSAELQKNLKKLKIADLDAIANEYIDLTAKADDQNNIEKYNGKSTYGMSKILVRALTHVLADPENYGNKFHFSSYCPGWCKSDMAGWEKPPRTAEQGARIAYWLGTSFDDLVVKNNGCFYKSDNVLAEWGDA